MASFTASAQQYASSVVSVTPGSANNATGIVAPGRAIAANALGAPQNSDATVPDAQFNAYSLGFGGSIVLKFDQPFTRGAGADFSLTETSFGNKTCNIYPEQARVYFSQTGAEGSFVLADSGCLDFSLELPQSLGWAQYVKVVDKSVKSFGGFVNIGDGYDLDGLTAPYLYTPTSGPLGNCVSGVLSKVISFAGGKRKDGCAVASCRQVPSNALGAANGEVCGPINYVSLGFGGTAVYEFEYTQFDRPGADLNVFETSWGDCLSFIDLLYPETAEFWGSNDGVTFYLLKTTEGGCSTPGRLVRDGRLDISTMPIVGGYRTLRFIKVIDKTDRCNIFFPYYADGYDLDAIVSTSCNSGCRFSNEPYEPTAEDAAIASAMLGTSLNVAPNPAAAGTEAEVNFTTEKAGTVSVALYDMAGKALQTVDNNSYEAGAHTVRFSTAGLKSGMYIVRMQGSEAALTQTVRLVVK